MKNGIKSKQLLPAYLTACFIGSALCSFPISAKATVSEKEAAAIADVWRAAKIDNNRKNNSEEVGKKFASLGSKSIKKLYYDSGLVDTKKTAEPYVYVVEYEDGGYVAIPANEALPPVISYSNDNVFSWHESEFNFNRIVMKSLSASMKKTSASIARNDKIESAWEDMRSLIASDTDVSLLTEESAKQSTALAAKLVTVNRILWRTATWWQYDPYHDAIVANCTGSGWPDSEWRVSVGCNAVAMSMIMRFHEFPATSSAIPNYTDNYNDVDTGALGPACNFTGVGNSNFNYAQMPLDDTDVNDPAVNNTSPQIAQLMYDAAISIQSDFKEYSASVRDHTSANHNICHTAMSTYFSYRDVPDVDLTNNAGRDALYESVVAGLPVFVHVAGHNVVVSGYETNGGIEYVYINWGHADPYNPNVANTGSSWYEVGAATDPMIEGNPFQSPTNYIYVDSASTATTNQGNANAAYNNLWQGYVHTPSGGSLWIRSGAYSVGSGATMTLGKSITYRSYDGTADINGLVKINSAAEYDSLDDVPSLTVRNGGMLVLK